MPESPKYKSNQFSLVLIIPGHKPKFVNIPKAKRSYRNEKTSGITTYQMAIDAYTTKFNNKDELLNDIRENGYATIKNISNDKISVYIIYKGQCSNTNEKGKEDWIFFILSFLEMRFFGGLLELQEHTHAQ